MQESIESRSGELLSIPLSRLVAAPRDDAASHNVRRTNGDNVDDLVASIRALGVLQNLIVCPARDTKGRPTGDYEVVGGRRRLKALQALAKAKEIAQDDEVLCRVKETRAAAEASLAENVVREPMHPADEFEAFKRLVDEGMPVEQVAARFGVAALTVRRRLKLADIHPQLVAQYRAGEVTLDQLMALAVSDDQEEQLRVWAAATPWNRNPGALRQALVADELDAARDPLVRFVGLAEYEAAGGPVRRDLFDEQAAGYVQDVALLRQLAERKLAAAAELVREEGWSWVEAVLCVAASELYRYERCRKTRREMRKAEAKRHAALARHVQDLDGRLERHFEGADDGLDDEAIAALEQEAEGARDALEKFEQALESWAPEAMAKAGAIVGVGRDGQVEVHRGLVRRGQRAGGSDAEGDDTGSNGQALEEPKTGRPTHPAALMLELTAHRTLAARAAMLDQPHVAMTALLHCLVQRLLSEGYGVAETAVKLLPNAPDAGLSSLTLVASKAAERLAAARARWAERIPGDAERLLPWIAALPETDRSELLALCVAHTLNDVRDLERAAPIDDVAGLLALDMGDWWEATADAYFSRVTKDSILAAIEEGAGKEAAARIKGVSKAELARVAERDLKGQRWLPAPLRMAGETQANAAPGDVA